MPEPRLIVGFHSVGTCPTQFAVDLARAMRYSGTAVPLALHEQSCYVDSARNKLVRQFLALDPLQASHFLMIDVDLSFPPDAFIKTLTIALTQQADILYGNYSLGNNGNSIFGPPENAAREAAVLVALQPNTLYSDIGTGGTGWLLMSRSILERMEKECPGPWHWFDRDPTADGKDKRGEDVTFGLRLWEMNPRPKVMATTHILLRHYKLQPFIPQHMTPVATAEKVPAIAMPNPYEVDKEHYEVQGNMVKVKKPGGLGGEAPAVIPPTPPEEKEDALRSSDGKVEGGGATQRLQDRAQGEKSEASDCHNA